MSNTENNTQTEAGKLKDNHSDNNQSNVVELKPHAELIDEIISQLEAFFATHLNDLFLQIDNHLFSAADEATSTDQQNNLFESMNAMRDNKKVIAQFFIDELSFYLQPISSLDSLPERKPAKKSTVLGLVEENEMDEMVVLASISRKAEMDNAEAINHLILRIKELSLSNDDIFHGEALEPKRFCDAIHAAVAKTNLIDEQKMLLYRFFNEVLMIDLKQFYDTLNNLFVARGILPEIIYSGYSVAQDNGVNAQENSDLSTDNNENNAVAQAVNRPQTRRAFGSGMSGFAQEQAQTQANIGPAGQEFSAGVPVGQVRQRLENYVGGNQANIDPAGTASFYSQQQVMTALTNLQVQINDLTKTPLVFDAGQIKKAILSSIGESDGGAITKSVHHFSEKTIDFIKLIFDAIIEEESITAEIKTLLLSLQIPVIKAAMQDADFFVDDQHPARQLLDKIAEAGVGVADLEDPVYIDIEKIVRQLLNNYDEDVIAFTTALDKLSQFTEEIYCKAREAEFESQKNANRAHAKSVVLREIRKITIGKALPEGIRTLVLKVWPSMLFNHFLRQGKSNDEWVELLMILQKIIESVQPCFLTDDLGLSYDDIIETTRGRLAKFKKNKDVVDQVINDLEVTYEEIKIEIERQEKLKGSELDSECVDQLVTTEHGEDDEGIALEQLKVEAEELEEDPELIAKEKLAKLPDNISPGSWFIVYNGEDKPVRRLKLAAILVHDASMVFVDYLGKVVIEKDAKIFADEFEEGLSALIMQHSVFDHALNSALETIKPVE